MGCHSPRPPTRRRGRGLTGVRSQRREVVAMHARQSERVSRQRGSRAALGGPVDVTTHLLRHAPHPARAAQTAAPQFDAAPLAVREIHDGVVAFDRLVHPLRVTRGLLFVRPATASCVFARCALAQPGMRDAATRLGWGCFSPVQTAAPGGSAQRGTAPRLYEQYDHDPSRNLHHLRSMNEHGSLDARATPDLARVNVPFARAYQPASDGGWCSSMTLASGSRRKYARPP